MSLVGNLGPTYFAFNYFKGRYSLFITALNSIVFALVKDCGVLTTANANYDTICSVVDVITNVLPDWKFPCNSKEQILLTPNKIKRVIDQDLSALEFVGARTATEVCAPLVVAESEDLLIAQLELVREDIAKRKKWFKAAKSNLSALHDVRLNIVCNPFYATQRVPPALTDMVLQVRRLAVDKYAEDGLTFVLNKDKIPTLLVTGKGELAENVARALVGMASAVGGENMVGQM